LEFMVGTAHPTRDLAATELDFERAAVQRDRITQFRDSVGQKVSDVEVESYKPSGKRGRRHKGGTKIPRPKRAT